MQAYGSAKFLLARLHVDSLLDKRTETKVLSTLGHFSKGSKVLDLAYEETIKRIEGQLPEDGALAKMALSWITYAHRPLTTGELCHALAVELGEAQLNPDSIPDVEDVVSVCAGLVPLTRKVISSVSSTSLRKNTPTGSEQNGAYALRWKSRPPVLPLFQCF
ncbi:hypothetical protein K469DRAFT_145303 [Zopfia rhizophila CBS 207.26]|uniref:GPI inositol-deacylase winged helix domain-containing protein n=1 Tax=Zopfia rhizophila CBS 207.26 TaxID=1314779 RepID=A0A6A6E6Z2_9PEZI|nr:hypothetical protein K469DRAFT_145303 [Zopfia rhizophila CBS 207.26]